MPFYDYNCDSCYCEFETSHPMNDKPVVVCPDCGSRQTHKIISACGIVIHSTGAQKRVQDHFRMQADARQDLKENFGVENVHPVGGEDFRSVYNDIRGRGSFVRDEMQKQRETNEKKSKAKRRAWTEKALRRTSERAAVKREKKLQEGFAKRALSIGTSCSGG